MLKYYYVIKIGRSKYTDEELLDNPTLYIIDTENKMMMDILDDIIQAQEVYINTLSYTDAENAENAEDAEDAENEVEPQTEINLTNLPKPPKINNTVPIKSTSQNTIPANIPVQSRVGGARSLGLFKQLELMVGSTVNLAKKVTRKAKKIGRNVSRRARKLAKFK